MYEFKINNIDWEISLADYDDIEACGLTTYCEYKIQVLKTLKPSKLEREKNVSKSSRRTKQSYKLHEGALAFRG